MSKLDINEQDLINNPSPRLPVCLVLDTSSSMSGEPIDELNKGIKFFFDNVKADEIAKTSAEISVVTFASNVEKILGFADIERQEIPVLSAFGYTHMGEGVNLALTLLEERKEKYKDIGLAYYQPIMVLMTDGKPEDEPINVTEGAIKRVCDLVNQQKPKLTIIPIAIGKYADMNFLKCFSPKIPPLRLKGLNFTAFFEWLSRSTAEVTQSNPNIDYSDLIDLNDLKDITDPL